MSFLTHLLNLFQTNIYTTITTIIIACIVYKISKFYYLRSILPPGPHPWPFIGNGLLSIRSEVVWDRVVRDLTKQYGPVFTYWFGSVPRIIVTDIDLAREAYRKTEFLGRTPSYFAKQLSNDEFKDIVFTDYGPTWEALRRVAHSAVIKYSANDRLVSVANDCVDQTVKTMLDNEGIGKRFAPKPYIFQLFLHILANITFGQNYNLEDPEFKQLKGSLRDFTTEKNIDYILWEFSSIIQLLDRKLIEKQRQILRNCIDLIRSKFQSHYTDYNESIERDFCDALIAAKEDALRANKKSAPYLTDQNLALTIFDLFFAGTNTTQKTFQWLLILMLYYPEVQRRLRREIEQQIGDRLPGHEDRQRCPYIMAFISETLRYRIITQFGSAHKTLAPAKMGKYNLPKDIGISVYQGYILRNNKDWEKPDEFIPERFLDSLGQFDTTRRPKAYIPFGVGPRQCPGERLAIADLFLVLVRFLQLTQRLDIVMNSIGGVDDLSSGIPSTSSPPAFEISFQNK